MSKLIRKIDSYMGSLKTRMILLIALVSIIVFGFVIYYTSYNLNTQLKAFIYKDLATKNKVYVSEISAIFRDRATIIKAVRDDLERYDTRGQMWVHLAAHTGESVFDDSENGEIYKNAFQKKLNFYYQNGQLSGDKMTKQIRLMIEQITDGDRKNAYGEGMKFFYIGLKSPNEDKIIQGYDEYQDSSLWVPDNRVDPPYNPLIRPWYIAGQKAGRDKVVFTEPYAEKRTKEALVSGGITINVEGQQGTLAGGISIKPIMEQIQISDNTDDQLSIFSRGLEKDVVYIKAAPKYIYSSRDKSLGENFKEYNDAEVIKNPINRELMEFYDYCKDKEYGVEEWTIGGEERLIAFHTIPELGWKVFNSVSKEKVLKNVAMTQMNNIYLSAFGLIVLLILFYMSISRSIKPIEVIKEDLVELSETGDLSKRMTVMTKDEIGQIAT